MTAVQINKTTSSTKIFSCKACNSTLCASQDLISRRFNGQHGAAYLFEKAINISLGEPEKRQMTTGPHIVRDINCTRCETLLGWKYDEAHILEEKYKEGKFLLEKNLMGVVEFSGNL